MTPVLSGCLDAPPEYQVPDQVPPVIMTDDVQPPTNSLNRPSLNKVPFTVPFRADDGGEGLLAYFVRDIPSGKPGFTNVIDNPAVRINADPRPFAEQTKRSFEFDWNWGSADAGCHTITLILSHESNFNLRNGEVDVIDPTKAARTTWFFELYDSTTTVPSCGDWPAPAMAATP